MTIDTAARRLSVLSLGARRGPSVYPDGTLNAADRSALIGLYSGLVAGNAYLLQPTSGSFAWTGYDVVLTPTTHINTANKRFSVMNMSSPSRGINYLPAGAVSKATQLAILYLYSGYAASANAYTLSAETGSFSWVGEPSFSDFEISCDSGVFGMTGNPATIIATRVMSLTSGVFAMTGNDATLIKFTDRTLVAEAGVFAMTGNDATLTRPRGIECTAGQFVMDGYRIALVYTNANGHAVEGNTARPGGGHHRHRHQHVQEVQHDEDELMEVLAIAMPVLLRETAH